MEFDADRKKWMVENQVGGGKAEEAQCRSAVLA
jgi:hypothetical protein